MKELIYKTQGTCAQAIRVILDDDKKIESVEFAGGCNGNTKGIAALVRGMKADDAIARLRGIRCGTKVTSCPDQLSYALEQCMQ